MSARTLIVNFGAAASGLSPTSVHYQVLAETGETLVARTNSGMAAISGEPGSFTVTVTTWNDDWAGTIRWDDAGSRLAIVGFQAAVSESATLDPAYGDFFTGSDLLDYVDLGPTKVRELDLVAQAVTELFESKTGRLWQYRANYVMDVQVNVQKRSFWLPLYPVTTIEIEERPLNTPPGGPLARTLDVDEYRLDAKMGRIDLTRASAWLGPDVRVTLTGGYDRPPTALIRRALLIQAQFEIASLKQESLHATNYSANRSNTNFRDPDLHPYFAQVIADNTRWV